MGFESWTFPLETLRKIHKSFLSDLLQETLTKPNAIRQKLHCSLVLLKESLESLNTKHHYHFFHS